MSSTESPLSGRTDPSINTMDSHTARVSQFALSPLKEEHKENVKSQLTSAAISAGMMGLTMMLQILAAKYGQRK